MKKLDKYLLKSFLGPFILTFLLVLFILMLQFLWLYIDELVGKGLSLGVIFEFLAWGSGTLIPMTLPLATLLASIMTLGTLGEHNELLSMKAAGISLGRILTPLIFVSVFIVVGAFLASNNLIPVSYQKIYALRDDIGRTKEEIKIPTGTFYDGIDGYILRVDHRDEETSMMYDLMVYDHTGNKGNTNLTVADSGSMFLTADKTNMIFTLYNGRTYDETNQIAFRDTVLDQSIISFDSQKLMIPLEDYGFTRSEEGRFGNEIMAKNLATLHRDRDTLATEYEVAFNSLFRRFIYSCELRRVSQLATTVQKKELGVFDLEGLYAAQDSSEHFDRIHEIPSKIDQAIVAVEAAQREAFHYVDPMRKMKIEMFRKFTLSLACLIFFFIGAPLGAIIRKGGLGTPVIISILFFVIYWVVDISGKKLARDGALSPFAGAFISTFVLAPIGVFLTWKSTKDSAIFKLESYKLFFKTRWDKVSSKIKKVTNRFKPKQGRIDVIYMGTPEFACGPLDALMQSEYNVAAVVTVPDKQSGRGLKVNESAVKKYAVEHNIPVLQPVSLKDPEFLAQLKSYNADIFVVVAFRMLPKEVWSMPRLGTFNLHASLLPQYRGAAPINWVLINGERQTGVTTFFIDEQIDTGKIIYSEQCLIESYDNASSLHDKLAAMGSALVVKSVEDIVRKRVKPSEQVAYTSLKPAPKLTRELGQINWSKDAVAINNLIRGLSSYPAAHSQLVCGDQITDVKIYEAYVRNEDIAAEPGTIFTDGKSYLTVACGEGSLRIMSLQVAGKKRMGIEDFLRGFREPEKYHFA